MGEGDKDHLGSGVGDLPFPSANTVFKSEEMIPCPKCGRTSPPTKFNCFYCGAVLESTATLPTDFKPQLGHKLEPWEKGFNLIYMPGNQLLDDAGISEISEMLNLERESLRRINETKGAFPLARVGTEREAKFIKKRLGELEVETFVLSDVALAIEKPLRRLRSVDFSEEGKIILILFNGNEIAEIEAKDLCLIITGAIFERKVEGVEKRKKKGENKVLQATETTSDEFLIDIYSRQDSIGYRILAKGFDFSCLGADKGFLANENLKQLVRKFASFAPGAKVVENYLKVREFLSTVWEMEEKNDSLGVKRQSFGSYNLENVKTVNNSAQFNKYSRMQWFLL